MSFVETATATQSHATHKRMAARGWNGVNAAEICRDKKIFAQMADVACILVGMLALRQEQAEAQGIAGRTAFARDDSNVRLAAACMDALDKVAQYGHPKLARLDVVGDAPQTTVLNKYKFTLKIGDPGAAGAQQHHHQVIDGDVNPETIRSGAGSNGGDGGHDGPDGSNGGSDRADG